MEKKRFAERCFGPVVKLFLVMAVSYASHDVAWHFDNRLLHNGLSWVFGPLFFLCLGFGPLYIYPKTYKNGASGPERVLCSLVNPFIWATKEVFVLTGIYTWGESLYYYLNPANMLLFSAVLAQIGLSELLCRRRAAGWGVKTGSAAAGWLALFVGTASVVSLFAWDLGVHHFYIFQEGYKSLFGYGLRL